MSGYDLLHAARFGNVAGGLNTTVIGAQGYRIDAQTLRQRAAEIDWVGS